MTFKSKIIYYIILQSWFNKSYYAVHYVYGGRQLRCQLKNVRKLKSITHFMSMMYLVHRDFRTMDFHQTMLVFKR